MHAVTTIVTLNSIFLFNFSFVLQLLFLNFILKKVNHMDELLK